MAKSTKKNIPVKKSKGSKEKRLSRGSLVAVVSDVSMETDIRVVFTSGLGQLTAVLFRQGVLINMQSISSSGTIHFVDVQSRDSISINGVCSGNATITVSIPTNPATPERFTAGIIMTGYTIL
jgi:hypothetical protein